MSENAAKTRGYWFDYGGWRALFASRYFWVALVGAGLLFPIWSKSGWWDLVLGIIPSLLGVSLAAFALFLGAGTERFRQLLASKELADEGGSPPFVVVSATFVHFIVVQVLAVATALFCSAAYKMEVVSGFEVINSVLSYCFWGIGFFFFSYSILLVLAAAFGIYEISRWFEEFVRSGQK